MVSLRREMADTAVASMDVKPIENFSPRVLVLKVRKDVDVWDSRTRVADLQAQTADEIVQQPRGGTPPIQCHP